MKSKQRKVSKKEMSFLRARKADGYTLKRIAEETGLSDSTIANILHGRTGYLRPETQARLAGARKNFMDPDYQRASNGYRALMSKVDKESKAKAARVASLEEGLRVELEANKESLLALFAGLDGQQVARAACRNLGCDAVADLLQDLIDEQAIS